VVFIDSDANENSGFEMDGGAITGNTLNYGVMGFYYTPSQYTPGVFIKTGGTISGNKNIRGGSPNNTLWFYNSDYVVTIEEGQAYFLPEPEGDY
jgi:hypothetical protein